MTEDPARRGKGGLAHELAPDISYRAYLAVRAFAGALAKRLAPHGISSAQWRFLSELWRQDGPTQAELSARVGSREPTTARAIDGLVQRGLVTRVRSDTDRRKTHVWLTRTGDDLRLRLSPIVSEMNRLASEGISSSDLEIFLNVLARITANVGADGGVADPDDAP